MKKSFLIVLVFILVISVSVPASARELEVLKAFSDYPRAQTPPPIAETITVNFSNVSEFLHFYQPVVVEATLGNIPSSTYASIQWLQDKQPLPNGYQSQVKLYNGMKLSYSGVLPTYYDRGTTTITLEITINGTLRSEYTVIPYKEGSYHDAEVLRVLGSVQHLLIPAKVTTSCSTYGNKFLGDKNGSVSAGTSVYYFDHNGTSSAYVQLPDSSFVWVPYNCISISSGNYTVEGDFSASDKEIFVNAKNFDSSTNYLVWINPERQKVNIFKGSKYKWKHCKTFDCTTGANETPTPVGMYKFTATTGAWITSTYRVKNVLYFQTQRGLAFHSRLYSPDGSYLTDATIGKPASHGCVRMYDEDLAWMKSNLPLQTTVVVH